MILVPLFKIQTAKIQEGYSKDWTKRKPITLIKLPIHYTLVSNSIELSNVSRSRNKNKPKIEKQLAETKLSEKDDYDSLLGLFKLLIKIGIKNNLENHKLHCKPNLLFLCQKTASPMLFVFYSSFTLTIIF